MLHNLIVIFCKNLHSSLKFVFCGGALSFWRSTLVMDLVMLLHHLLDHVVDFLGSRWIVDPISICPIKQVVHAMVCMGMKFEMVFWENSNWMLCGSDRCHQAGC